MLNSGTREALIDYQRSTYHCP